MKGRIEFEPIPGPTGGMTHLGIYPPGTFMDNKTYHVFVGGCGVGHRLTLRHAKKYLLEAAKNYCHRQITQAEHIVDHYRRMLNWLERDGLQPLNGRRIP